MSRKLELVREEKLFRLLPGRKESSRLEASGVALLDGTTALVIFDNLNHVARIDLSLKRRSRSIVKSFDLKSSGNWQDCADLFIESLDEMRGECR